MSERALFASLRPYSDVLWLILVVLGNGSGLLSCSDLIFVGID